MYRETNIDPFDGVTTAILELRHRMGLLRRRRLLPAVVGGGAAGCLAVVLHASGYWSIFGDEGGAYLVAWFTLAIAFLSGALPFAAIGAVAYLAGRSRLRAQWMDDFAGKHGVSREELAKHVARFP